MAEKIVVKQPPKSPALAIILSIFFPGAGALYNREYIKGILYIFLFAALVTLQSHGDGQPFKALLLAGFYIFQIIEAGQTAKSINLRVLHGEAAAAAEAEDFSSVARSGSVFWGIVLVVIGVLLLMANYGWVVTYETIYRFWPLVIVVFGGKLIVDYYARKK